MSAIGIQDIRREIRGDYVELSARITGIPGDRLWFRFPARWVNWVEESPEPFLAALLPVAMSKNLPLRAEGQVSLEFKSGLDKIGHVYHRWDRRLKHVKIDVQTAHKEDRGARAAGCFFTGGVDSFYTVLKNLEREQGENRISHLIFIHGYADCPLDNTKLWNRLVERLGAVADDFKLELIAAETNLKTYTPAPGVAWDWFAGSQLASVGLCLAGGLRRLYIPGGDTYNTLSPWGSHPMVDPLWSTEWLEFRHDGCEAYRSEKLDRVARSAPALKRLWVCGYDPAGIRNCGTCEKCLRTMIGLAALRADVPRELFAEPLAIVRVRRLDGGNRVIRYYLRDNLKLLRKTKNAGLVRLAVEHALRPNPLRAMARAWQWTAREIDRVLFRGRIRAWALGAAGSNPVKHADLRSSPSKWFARELVKVAERRTRNVR